MITKITVLLSLLLAVCFLISGCGSLELPSNASVQATIHFQDGSTLEYNEKGELDLGELTEKWHLSTSNLDTSGNLQGISLYFDQSVVTESGTYEVGGEEVDILFTWEGAQKYSLVSTHGESGQIQIESMGYEIGDNWRGTFDNIILKLNSSDEDTPNPAVSLSDGRFEATNEGEDGAR